MAFAAAISSSLIIPRLGRRANVAKASMDLSGRSKLNGRLQQDETRRARDRGGSSVNFAHFLLASADGVVADRCADRRPAAAPA
jgi:hypothetical protein